MDKKQDKIKGERKETNELGGKEKQFLDIKKKREEKGTEQQIRIINKVCTCTNTRKRWELWFVLHDRQGRVCFVFMYILFYWILLLHCVTICVSHTEWLDTDISRISLKTDRHRHRHRASFKYSLCGPSICLHANYNSSLRHALADPPIWGKHARMCTQSQMFGRAQMLHTLLKEEPKYLWALVFCSCSVRNSIFGFWMFRQNKQWRVSCLRTWDLVATYLLHNKHSQGS